MKRRLLDPSANLMVLVVLTKMDWGDERKPRESRTVTTCPGVVAADRNTIVDSFGPRILVSTSTTDVLAFTIYDGISLLDVAAFS